MSEWCAIPFPLGSGYILNNNARTLITIHKNYDYEVSRLLSTLEERNVPFGFSNGLKSIRLTSINSDDICGDYSNDRIRICLRSEIIETTFIHELGHHVDTIESISDDPGVIEEKRTQFRFLSDKWYARRSVSEYVAVGFEDFYSDDEKRRARMRRHNKRLYARIMSAHRKHSRT